MCMRVYMGLCVCRYVGLVGLGKAEKATATPEWGVSAFQQAGTAAAVAAKQAKAVSAALALVSAPPSLSSDGAKAMALGQIATGRSAAEPDMSTSTHVQYQY